MSKRPLQEYRVTLERMQRGKRSVPPIKKGNYDHVGMRTKLGGKPDWIQNDETPECPDCDDTMWFVGQIDSLDAAYGAPRKKDFMFGDAGMLYIFFCFDCEQHAIVHQFH